MGKIFNSRNLLLAIIVLAFVFRIWGIGNRDFFGDEGVDAFRGVGYVDYLGTSFQTQPIDWYKNSVLPWWTALSFHDFPPLAMAIQHAFFAVFGDSVLVARLPAVILGVLSALLIYLIVRRFLDENIALLAGFLFSINSVMVWISRTAILEPILLFLILLNIYCFFRFIDDRSKTTNDNPNLSRFYRGLSMRSEQKNWILFGGTLGLVALTKYTGVFLLPVYLSYFSYKSYWSDKPDKTPISPIKPYKSDKTYWIYLLFAFGLALLLFSPVLIYNFYLYSAVGHFDLQFAYLLGQETPEWTGLVGKVQSPFSEILTNLTTGARESDGFFSSVVSYQIPFLISVVIGFLYFVFRFVKKTGSWKEREFTVFLCLYFIFATLLLIKIGSAHRFLTLYGPIFIIFSAVALNWLWIAGKQFKFSYFFKFLIIIFLIWEFSYSIGRNFIQIPDYGIAKLDNYLSDEFRNKESAVIPESDNPHLNEIIKKFANDKKSENRELFMIVYNDNVELPILDWIFYRRFFYHSIPALFVENFSKAISIQGEDYFRNFEIYFIQSTEHTLLNQFKKEKTVGLEFEDKLQKMGYQPVKIIYGHNSLPMFRVYKFLF